MGLWERIQAALRREKRDLDQAVDDVTRRADEALDRRERELNATAAEKVALEQKRAKEIDAEFDAVRKRIEGD